MATGSDNVYSETLQSIIDAKLVELTKKRTSFEDAKGQLLQAADQGVNKSEKLQTLLAGVKSCFKIRTGPNGRIVAGSTNYPQLELKLKTLERFLEQPRYDPSVSAQLLQDWEHMLTQQLDVQSSRYEFASLYGQLVTEWLSAEKKLGRKQSGDDVEMSESFEEVESKAKLESRLAWEKSVFEPFDTDAAAIRHYLRLLFGEESNNKQALKALSTLRQDIETFENSLVKPGQFNHQALKWTIDGLLATEILTEEKRNVLRDFSSNVIILTELADVLNLRMASLETWSWGDSVPVESRRCLGGGYNLHMQEELLQAIFLQYIGVKWSVFVKKALKTFMKNDTAWKSSRGVIPIVDKKRREYFLGVSQKVPSVQSKRESLWQSRYFMSQLLNSQHQEVVMDDGAEEADYAPALKKRTMQTAMQRQQYGQTRPRQLGALFAPSAERFADKAPNIDGECEPDDDYDTRIQNPAELKQGLLHILSTEILINTRLHGDFTCFRAQFENWNPMLPHSTILAVLNYLGVSQTWLRFFSVFLAAPLAMVEDSGLSQSRTRKRGVPASHPLSDVFSEAVLFCMDLAVNHTTTGTNIWRLHDDVWFWSTDHQKCVKAWLTITSFTSLFGLSLDVNKRGTVRIQPGQPQSVIEKALPEGEIRWGFLNLSPKSGRFEIDQTLVSNHIAELRTQLAGKTDSVFSWVQAWSTYAGTFFSTNFGKPANCFGQAHINSILTNLERVQREVFLQTGSSDKGASGSVASFLKDTVTRRFGVQDIPDGYIFFPAELGGLNLCNPLINCLQIHDSVSKDPSELLETFVEAEKEAYQQAKTTYLKYHLQRHALENPNYAPPEGKTGEFMPFEEFTKYREEFAYDYANELRDVYDKLLEEPEEVGIDLSLEMQTLMTLMDRDGVVGQCGINGDWSSMSAYWKWVVGMYGPEIVRKFGGLNIVDNGVLPVGMVGLVRGKRVKWSD